MLQSVKTPVDATVATAETEKVSGRALQALAGEASGPVFVVGMWRSGTSLFYALLNQHPDIALMYEGDLFLLRRLFRVPGARSRWAHRWQFWNQALTRHKIEIDTQQSRSCTFRESCELAYRQAAMVKGARIWGEKSPNYYDSLVPLAREFPTAKFIIIWRAPGAICRSILQAARSRSSWFKRRGMMIRTLLGYRLLKEGCDELLRLGVPLQQIHYEELVQDPAAIMRQVCRFLDVPFHSRIASLQKADRSAIYEGAHHSLVNSENIVESRADERGDSLPSTLKKKIDRYVAFWRKQSDGSWPTLMTNEAVGSSMPSRLERSMDACGYIYFRGLDSAISVVYSLAPMRLLRAWRRIAHGDLTEESH